MYVCMDLMQKLEAEEREREEKLMILSSKMNGNVVLIMLCSVGNYKFIGKKIIIF